MPWFKTKTAVTVAAVLLLAGAGLAAKRVFWPVTDSIFQLDSRKLEKAPAGIVLVRPTHFSDSAKSGVMVGGFKPGEAAQRLRVIGRNVPLTEVLQAAYACNPARIVLPSDSPTDTYDFLVTTSKNPQERLQAEIKKKLGYVAHREMRDTEVLQLVISMPGAPGLQPSGTDHGGMDYNNGKIRYRHQTIAALAAYLEAMLKQPVRDKTGLSGFYDYSVDWNLHIRTGTPNRDDFAKSLQNMGLALKTGRETLEMLVVERVNN